MKSLACTLCQLQACFDDVGVELNWCEHSDIVLVYVGYDVIHEDVQNIFPDQHPYIEIGNVKYVFFI